MESMHLSYLLLIEGDRNELHSFLPDPVTPDRELDVSDGVYVLDACHWMILLKLNALPGKLLPLAQRSEILFGLHSEHCSHVFPSPSINVQAPQPAGNP